jgi:hypothetical protein
MEVRERYEKERRLQCLFKGTSKTSKSVRGTRGGVSDCMQSAAERRKHMQVLSLVEPHLYIKVSYLQKHPSTSSEPAPVCLKPGANGGFLEVSLNEKY